MEVLKWSCVVVLLMFASIGSYFYRDSCFVYRVVVVCLMLMFAGYLALTTNYGKSVIIFSKKAHEEVRKVVWPTIHETLYVTLVVIVVTVVVALILWGLDVILVYLVSLSLRL